MKCVVNADGEFIYDEDFYNSTINWEEESDLVIPILDIFESIKEDYNL